MANPNIIIDYNKTLSDNLYDILYKWITEDEYEDNRGGIQSFSYHPLDSEGEEITDEWPNSVSQKTDKRSINERQHEILLNLTDNLAKAVEQWTIKQTFNITEMECPINVENVIQAEPINGAPNAGGPVVIPAMNLNPITSKGTAEIGQTSALQSQNTSAIDAIDESKVKLQYPDMTSDETSRETINSEE
jgi:hypothetical protein